MFFLRNFCLCVIGLCTSCGRSFLFLLDILIAFRRLPIRFKQIIKQIYFIGVMSLPIIIISGVFVGMVISFQGYTTLVRFGAESALGTMVSLSILREIGPVITALLFAGRAGSAMTSEIGLMKTTEQISSMNMIAVSPAEYVYFPKFLATLIVMPILSVIFCFVALWGAYFIGVVQFGVDSGVYWNGMKDSVRWLPDVFQGIIIKSLSFGFIAAFISVYQGAFCHPTSEGIGRATTKSVVVTSILVLALDFLLTAIFYGIN